MSTFRHFEQEVVRILVRDSIPQLDSLLDNASLVSYEHTGVGYFLTVRHSGIGAERIVCDQPIIVGKATEIECGFIVFLENGTLTLECHSWDGNAIPNNFRDQRVEIAITP